MWSIRNIMRKKFLLFFFLLFFMVILQSSVLPRILPDWFSPNFILAGVLFAVLRRDFTIAVLFAGIGGLFLDLFSGGKFGVFSLSFLGAAAISHLAFKFFLEQDKIFVFLFFSFAWLLAYCWYFSLMSPFLINLAVIWAVGFFDIYRYKHFYARNII